MRRVPSTALETSSQGPSDIQWSTSFRAGGLIPCSLSQHNQSFISAGRKQREPTRKLGSRWITEYFQVKNGGLQVKKNPKPNLLRACT